MSTSAASHLPPAYPERAAWGTAGKLRAWQADALERYLTERPRDFLAVATPGAGKTTFALRVATELLDRGEVQRICVVAPTEHLKTQWAEAAARKRPAAPATEDEEEEEAERNSTPGSPARRRSSRSALAGRRAARREPASRSTCASRSCRPTNWCCCSRLASDNAYRWLGLLASA